jgi:hypothetical protein
MFIVENTIHKYFSAVIVIQIANDGLPLDVISGFQAFLDDSIPAVQDKDHVGHAVERYNVRETVAVEVTDGNTCKVVGYLVGRTPGQFHREFRKRRWLCLAICVVARVSSKAGGIVSTLLVKAIDESIAIIVNTIVANLHGLGERKSGDEYQGRSKNK